MTHKHYINTWWFSHHRKLAGLSQAQLAEMMGVKLYVICDLERNKAIKIDIERARLMSKAINVPHEDVLARMLALKYRTPYSDVWSLCAIEMILAHDDRNYYWREEE